MKRYCIREINILCPRRRAENNTDTDDEVIVDPTTPDEPTTDDYEDWSAGVDYKQGDIISWRDYDYIVMQDHTSQEQWQPDMDGMLALYMIYRGDGEYEWLYGEYVEQYWIRTYEGKRYECITVTAVSNIYPPTQATGVWMEIS